MKYIKELEKSTGKKFYNEEEMKQQIEKYNRVGFYGFLGKKR